MVNHTRFQVWTICNTDIEGRHFSIVASDKTCGAAIAGAIKSAACVHSHAHGKPLYWTDSNHTGYHLVKP